MRLFTLFMFPLFLQAQIRPNLTSIPAGTTQAIVVQIATAPVAGDAIYFQISTKQLSIVLVTPDGARITKQTAEEAGFDWGNLDAEPPIGSTDAGAIGSMHFLRSGVAGKYVVEFTAPTGVHNASASAQYLSEEAKYSELMSQALGFQKIGPTQLNPGQEPLEIVVAREEEGAIFDLVTSTGSPLSLTLPNGQTVDNSIGEQGKISWKTGTRNQIDPPDAMVGISGFLLPKEGIHQVVMFENAAKGKYQVRALRDQVQVTAAFIPFGSMMKAGSDALVAPPHAPAGQTLIQPYALPYDAKVGDNVTATIGIVGEVLSDPRFVVRMEYRQIISRDPVQFSAPVVEAVPTVFKRNADGLYEGGLVPRRPGILRVGVKVTGRQPNGQAFSEEVLLTTVNVSSR